jgi:hypothetical protein
MLETSQPRRTERSDRTSYASCWLARGERGAVIGGMFFSGKDQELVSIAG